MAIILALNLTKITFQKEVTDLPPMIVNPLIQRSSACTNNIATPVLSGLFVPIVSLESRDTEGTDY